MPNKILLPILSRKTAPTHTQSTQIDYGPSLLALEQGTHVIYTSSNGETWVPTTRTTHLTEKINWVIKDLSYRYVAVTSNGNIITADDDSLASWETVYTIPDLDIKQIHYMTEVYIEGSVISRDEGYLAYGVDKVRTLEGKPYEMLYYSTDLEEWFPLMDDVDLGFRGIHSMNSIRSSDAAIYEWACVLSTAFGLYTGSINDVESFRDVEQGEYTFSTVSGFAAGGNLGVTVNGTNQVALTELISLGSQVHKEVVTVGDGAKQWKVVLYMAPYFVLAGSGGYTSMSVDGVTWTTPSVLFAGSGDWVKGTANAGFLCLVSSTGKITTTDSLSSWTTPQTVLSSAVTCVSGTEIPQCEMGMLIAAKRGDTTKTVYLTSTPEPSAFTPNMNGLTWQAYPLDAQLQAPSEDIGTYGRYCMVYADGVYYSLFNNMVVKSTDLTTWQFTGGVKFSAISAIHYKNDKLYLTTFESADTDAFESSDLGVTWTASTLANTKKHLTLQGDPTPYLYFSDAVTDKLFDLGVTYYTMWVDSVWVQINYVDTYLVKWGSGSVVEYSANGTVWTPFDIEFAIPGGENIQTAFFTDGYFYFVGYTFNIYRSALATPTTVTLYRTANLPLTVSSLVYANSYNTDTTSKFTPSVSILFNNTMSATFEKNAHAHFLPIEYLKNLERTNFTTTKVMQVGANSLVIGKSGSIGVMSIINMNYEYYDGYTLEAHPISQIPFIPYDITQGGPMVVVVGSGGNISLTNKEDLPTIAASTQVGTSDWTRVVFYNSAFWAVSTDGKFTVSYNLLDWSIPADIPGLGECLEFKYIDKSALADVVGSDEFHAIRNNVLDVCVATGRNGKIAILHGNTWYPQTVGTCDWNCVTRLGSMMVLGSSSGVEAWSARGKTWYIRNVFPVGMDLLEVLYTEPLTSPQSDT